MFACWQRASPELNLSLYTTSSDRSIDGHVINTDLLRREKEGEEEEGRDRQTETERHTHRENREREDREREKEREN